MGGVDLLNSLPEGCISHILSFTSPRDACSSSAICSIFRSASESDVVWERFLPSDYSDIIARSVSPLQFSFKKELYFRLCNSILIDEGKMSFSLEKLSGRKCFMLSAKELAITWGETPEYWRWTSLPESRFSEVAELLAVCWLEIRGKINAHLLSPKTTYRVYLVMNFARGWYGLNYPAAAMSVNVGAHTSNRSAIFKRQQNRHDDDDDDEDEDEDDNYDFDDDEQNRSYVRHRESRGDEQIPQARSDGWMEIEMGEFFNDEGEEGDVEMRLLHTSGGHWKKGLIVEGIEIRPIE